MVVFGFKKGDFSIHLWSVDDKFMANKRRLNQQPNLSAHDPQLSVFVRLASNHVELCRCLYFFITAMLETSHKKWVCFFNLGVKQ